MNTKVREAGGVSDTIQHQRILSASNGKGTQKMSTGAILHFLFPNFIRQRSSESKYEIYCPEVGAILHFLFSDFSSFFEGRFWGLGEERCNCVIEDYFVRV